MESQKIHILLHKYFEAESTLEEEMELIAYFNSGKVDEEFKSYVPLFAGLKELSANENEQLGDDLMNYILESENTDKLKYRWMWQIVSGVAAAGILVMLAVNFYSPKSQWNDTFSDPQLAYAEANKTLEFVAGKYNKGLAQLKPIGKIEEAAAPFYSGMETWNRGMEQLEDIENLNTTIKNE